MLLWNLNFPSLIFSQNETHCSLKFNNAKCKVLHLGQSNPKHKHRVSIKWIEGHPEEKTGGCWLAKNFTWAGGMHLQPRKPTGLIQKYGQPVKPVWKKGINFLAGSFAMRIRGNGFGFFFQKKKVLVYIRFYKDVFYNEGGEMLNWLSGEVVDAPPCSLFKVWQNRALSSLI